MNINGRTIFFQQNSFCHWEILSRYVERTIKRFYLIFCLSFQIHRRFTDALTLVIKNSEGCNISPNKRKSMVVALNGSHYGASQDFLAEDLLDISKENEIENAAVSEAAALSTHIIARKLTSHASYTTSLFPRITQV